MIEHLKLTNFKRHENLEINFQGGLTVLAGANEAGKSSILHAILYALYGSRALPRSLDGTVTYGRAVSTLRVDLRIRIAGVVYSIYRAKSGAEMSGGGNLASGQSEVTAAVERLLGVPMAVATKLLVANQMSLRGVADEGSAAVKLIEELAELDAIEVLVDKVQAQLPTGSTAALSAQAAALAGLQEPVLVSLDAEAEGAKTLAEAKVAASAAASQQLAQAREALAQQEVRVHQYAAWQRDIDRLLAVINMPRTQEVVWTSTDIGVLEAAAEAQRLDAEVRSAWDQWQKLTPVVEPGPAPDPNAAQVKVLELSRQAQELRTKMPQIEATCEHCGSSLPPPPPEVLEEWSRLQAQVQDLLPRIEAAKLEKLQAQEAYTAWCSAVESWKGYERACARVGAYVKNGVWVGPSVSSEVDTTDYIGMIKAAQVKQRQMAVLAERIRSEKQQVEAATQELAKLQQAGPEKSGDLTGMHVEVKALTAQAQGLASEATLATQAAADLVAQNAANKATYAAECRAFKAAKHQHEGLLATISQMDANNALVKKLRIARPAIAAKLWAGLLGAIGSTFSQLRGTPSVVTRSADGFEVDGKPVADLSGSTLDVLGLSVRVALLRAFLPGVGFLILDEPSAACDAEREATLLGTLVALGLEQVLLVSHSEAAKAVAGDVVQL